MNKKRHKLSPIITFVFLIVATIVLSGILSFFNVQAEYATVNTNTNSLVNNIVQVENLFSGSGLKYIVTRAVSDFVSFAPLSMLIIVLIGIGIMEKTGFLRTCFTVLTKGIKKNTLTFILILISLAFSLVGDIGYVIMLPIGALLFKYGKRNPLGGIIATFASMSFGYGINLFLSSVDTSLLSLTLNASKVLDIGYTINPFFSLFVMLVVLILVTILFTNITEKNIMPRLGKYEFDEEEVEFKVTNKELRGLIVGVGAGILYILLIIYMIIPGLPLSGVLLDHSGTYYIDMLFGSNSLFNQGFIFIVTLLFLIMGFFYGIMAKTITNNKDVTEGLAYSLDGIGSILVLIFVASLYISVFKLTNIGVVITALLTNLIGSYNFTGIGLILVLLLATAISNIFYTGPALKWSIMAGTIVPLFMNASLSPEFAQLIFVAGDNITNGLTPLLAYFVIYIAFLEKYSKGTDVTLFGSIKYMVPYSITITVVWFVILVGWYVTGLPIGIDTLLGVTYGA